MLLELICPAETEFRNLNAKSIHNGALQAIAAITPPEWEIRVVEETYGDTVKFRPDVDVVGITAMTPQIRRAYEIADLYRQLGVKVVMGGIHPSVLPDEALRHADAVVVGEAELVWADVLADLRKGQSRGKYQADRLARPEEIPAFRRDVFKQPTSFNLASVQASRGCPHDCEFCSANLFFGRTFRFRPVDHVMAELESLSSRFIFFLDDNIFASPRYIQDLSERMIPLRKQWICQTSLHAATRDTKLLRLAVRSGLAGVFVGLESIALENLKATGSLKKNAGSLHDVSERFKILQDHGVTVMAAMIFGFDHDDAFVFDRTVEFLHQNKIAFASLALLTPYPGTRLHARLEAERRIFDRDWSHYNNDTVVFHPSRMTPQQLKDGGDWASYEFFKLRHAVTKVWTHRHHPVLFSGTALGWWAHSRKYKQGWQAHEAERRFAPSLAAQQTMP